jgi:hypothetical protein
MDAFLRRDLIFITRRAERNRRASMQSDKRMRSVNIQTSSQLHHEPMEPRVVIVAYSPVGMRLPVNWLSKDWNFVGGCVFPFVRERDARQQPWKSGYPRVFGVFVHSFWESRHSPGICGRGQRLREEMRRSAHVSQNENDLGLGDFTKVLRIDMYKRGGLWHFHRFCRKLVGDRISKTGSSYGAPSAARRGESFRSSQIRRWGSRESARWGVPGRPGMEEMRGEQSENLSYGDVGQPERRK